MLKKNVAQENKGPVEYPKTSDTEPPKGSNSKSLKTSSEKTPVTSQKKVQDFEFTSKGTTYAYRLEEDEQGFFTLKDKNGREIVGELSAEINQKEEIYQALVQHLKITAENSEKLKKIAGLDIIKI